MKVGKHKTFLLGMVAFLVFLGCSVPQALAQSFGYRMPITVNSGQVSNGPQTNFPFLFSSTSDNLKTAASTGYGYYMPITVNSGQVSNGPQLNFPFLFSSTSANLRTTGHGGHVQESHGYDIIFRALDDTTCGGTGKAPCTLSHEIEKYDDTDANHQFVAWVKVPSINTNTQIYVYYGNSSISTSQENKTGVWDSNYKGVWHLGNGTTLTANDSTNVNNGSLVNSQADIQKC